MYAGLTVVAHSPPISTSLHSLPHSRLVSPSSAPRKRATCSSGPSPTAPRSISPWCSHLTANSPSWRTLRVAPWMPLSTLSSETSKPRLDSSLRAFSRFCGRGACTDYANRPMGVTSGPDESVVANLGCTFSARVSSSSDKPSDPISPSSGSHTPESPPETRPPSEADGCMEAGQDKSTVVDITMSGELQVGVAWDQRHPFFPGQRITVRFRLVG